MLDFLNELDHDLRENLLIQLRNLWTHTSTALQHMLFCERQCASVHVEQQWDENRCTAEGRILHERADTGRPESRKGLRLEFRRGGQPK
jgi:hypothetical protein